MSVYPLDEDTSWSHKHLQCIVQTLYNDPKEVLSGDLFVDLENVKEAVDCLDNCRKKNYDLAFIKLIEESR